MFVTADNHFGYDSATTTINRVNINMMNNLPGVAYPANIGGTVGTPAGVIVAGDLTQDGKPDEWDDFESHYPLHGGTGTNEIHYEVYECTGNHDRHWEPNWFEQQLGYKSVKEEVAERHGDQEYGFDIQGIQFYSVDQYPTEYKCEWLGGELASIGTEKPVVLFFHFDMWDDEWWSPSDRERFRQAIDGYNILCILHGHKHNSFIYEWNGYDVLSPGSPKSVALDHTIGVLNITDTELTWAEYSSYDSSGNLTSTHWEQTYVKSLVVADPIPGDTNLDGVVNGTDAATLADNWLSTDNVSWSEGDFNEDGIVDASDATVLAANWQIGTSAAASAPEPSVLTIIAWGCFVLLGRRSLR